MYLGISPSKFDELRKSGRVGPPKILDGCKLGRPWGTDIAKKAAV